MAMVDIIDSYILTAEGREVMVTVNDDGTIGVRLIDRAKRASLQIQILNLHPADAHQLGNKLRLAARKSQ